jgi:ribosome recycling factor
MIQDAISETNERMRGAIKSLDEDLAAIRTGRANPGLVEKLQVEYYGTLTPLKELASISVPEPRTLQIRPFDASTLKNVERAILASELGLTPNNDGHNLYLNLPPLTEERRRDLVKLVHRRLEEAKVAVRNVRRDIIRDLREFEEEKLISEDEMARGEEEVQKVTDKFSEQIDEIGRRKEREIMEV